MVSAIQYKLMPPETYMGDGVRPPREVQRLQKDVSEARAKIAFNLLSPDKAQPTILYIVYSTIKANSSITLNQLRWLLHTEFLFPEALIDSAVGTLSSDSLFHIVNKWWAADRPDVIRLSVKATPDEAFNVWLAEFYEAYPELRLFVPPPFKKKPRETQ